ncbi:MAG: phosphotransferase [Nitrospinaceae bacterium]
MTDRAIPDGPFPSARFDRDYLAASLEAILHSPVTEISCVPLAGDASDRKYFRVSYENSAGENRRGSAIVMQLKEPAPDIEPDFNRMLRFLRKLGSPVPELFYYDTENGLLFLEDCGPETLEDRIRKNPGETREYYLQAVRILVELQHGANRAIGPQCPAFHLRFDVEKLMWEFDFMLKHYVVGLNKAPLSETDAGEVRKQFLPLCEELENQEPCFTHRDYHSRNLMANGERLVMLDFQDARMGPCQYDLVSLLKDSYIVLDDGLRKELAETYIRLKEEADGRPIDRENFYRVFDMMSIQRNLKAVGTFAFQSVEKRNDRYLQYIPPTLEYVRRTLAEHPELPQLRETLIKFIPGLASGSDTNST